MLSRSRMVDLGCVGLIICASLAISLPRYRIGIDWADEGFLSYGAVRVMEGQVPNRDFVSLQPPLSFYAAAATFKLLGTSLWSLRVLGLAIHLSIALLIYGIARRFLAPAFSLGAALPAIILGIPMFDFVPFAVWQGIAASLAAACFFLSAAFRQRRSLAVVSGVLTTISIGLRQDQGVYLAISLVVLFLVLRFSNDNHQSARGSGRVFVAWLAGAGFAALGLLVWWWAEGALPEMFKQLVVFPLTTYGKTSALPFPRFGAQQSFGDNSLTALFYLPPIVICSAITWIVQRIVRRGFSFDVGVFTFLVVWSGLYFCQALTRSDLSHLLITLPPFFLLLAFFWHLLLASLANKTIRACITVVGGAAAVWFLWTIHSFVLPDPAKPNEDLGVNRGGVRIEGGHWVSDFVCQVQQLVPPDRSILVLPYQPMFYFLCERRDPTRWNYLWPGDQTLADHEEFIAEAKKDPPAAVLITGEDDVDVYAGPILDYVHREYQSAAEFGRIRVYLPANSTR